MCTCDCEQGVEYYVDHMKGEFFIVTNVSSIIYKVCTFLIVSKGWSTVLITKESSSLLLQDIFTCHCNSVNVLKCI